MTATGWTPQQCRDEVTMSDYNMLIRYWRKYPPVHLLVRGLFDFSRVDDEQPAEKTPRSRPRPSGALPAKNWKTESVESLMARWAAVGGTVGHA